MVFLSLFIFFNFTICCFMFGWVDPLWNESNDHKFTWFFTLPWTVSLEWMELSVTGSLPPPRCGHTATMVEKRLLVYGGRGKVQCCNYVNNWLFISWNMSADSVVWNVPVKVTLSCHRIFLYCRCNCGLFFLHEPDRFFLIK